MESGRGESAVRPGIQPSWPPVTNPAPLEDGEVQVCCAVLDRSDDETHLVMEWLSAEERARAERAGTELLRRRFIVRRGIVRGLLGRALGRSPGDIVFRTGDEGMPSVQDGPGLSFSLAHSGPLALVAMARRCRVGVDVEFRSHRKDLEGLAARAFCPQEAEALRATPDAARLEAFYRVWTRKEALAKALGKGIASSFHRFSVSPDPAEGSRPAHMELPGESPEDWVLMDLDPAPGYSGALAVDSAGSLVPARWSVPLPWGLGAPAPDARRG